VALSLRLFVVLPALAGALAWAWGFGGSVRRDDLAP
jgi:hypothetical protein